MKRVACIKYAGLGSGGTEKYLQTLACVLRQEYEVDYYYTNNSPILYGPAHPLNSVERKQFVESYGIRTIPIHVDAYDNSSKRWIGSNVWDVIDPKAYDAVQTARYGYSEFPFTDIRGTKLIDSIHGDLCDHVSKVERSILLCKWQADKWVASGGNASKISIIPSLVYVPNLATSTMRQRLGIPKDAFVYGMHQRNDDGIFSPVSLQAYSQVQQKNTYFVLLGGSQKHRDMVVDLKLENVVFLDFTSNVEEIHDFLGGLDVYTHSRSDGEVCSASIIEAMYHGLPVVTHPAQNMGHLEQIDGCGKMTYSIEEYVKEMVALRWDSAYYGEVRRNTLHKYNGSYCYKTIERNLLDIYRGVLS